jgi:GLPGLI family protein
MKSLVVTLLLLSTVCCSVSAQKLEGEITYEKTYHWTRIYSRLTFLSNEEKDRMKMTWGKDDEYKKDMKLYFNENKTFYSYPPNQENDGGWSWNEKDFRIYRDQQNEKKTDVIEMLGKTYIVEDSIKVPKWKVMNKIKEIAGYMCMMAVTEDTIKDQKITAWFADNLPVTAGPELYGGLPGMILELDINDGDITVTAKKVEMKTITEEIGVPKKLKGKKITNQQYDQLLSTHIRDSIKAHRNPYWALPY